MDSDGFIWRDAEVTYPDWKGTAQLDQRITAPGIAEVVGLDPKRWFVVGFDMGGGETRHDLHVIAVDRSKVGDDSLSQIAEANGGEIPVTDFLIHDVDPYEVLRKITHVFELRMRVRAASDIPIRVVGLSDVPEQE